MSAPRTSSKPPDDAELVVGTVRRMVEHWGAEAVVKPTADNVKRIVEYKQIINGVERVVRLTISIHDKEDPT